MGRKGFGQKWIQPECVDIQPHGSGSGVRGGLAVVLEVLIMQVVQQELHVSICVATPTEWHGNGRRGVKPQGSGFWGVC